MRFGLIFKLVVSFTALLTFLIGLFVFSNSYILIRYVNDNFIKRLDDISLHIGIEVEYRYEDPESKMSWDNTAYNDGYPHLWFRVSYDDGREGFTFGDRPDAPAWTKIDTKLSRIKDGWFDRHYPLTYKGEMIGDLELAIRTDRTKKSLRYATFRNVYLGVLEVLLGSIFALLIGLWLISRLRDLEQASYRICRGDYGVHIDVEGHDEIAQTANAFNDMSQELQKTVFELEKARNQFMSIFDTAHDGILILDENKKIINANQAIYEIFGYNDSDYMLHEDSIDDFLNQDFSVLSTILGGDIFTPEMLEDLSLFDRKDPFTIYNRKDEEIHIKISPSQFSFDNRNYISLMIQNVSTSYKNELAIHESETRFRTIINTSLDGMIILDDNANINLISPAAERILGLNKHQAVGQNFIEKVLSKKEGLKFQELLEFYKDIQDHSVFGSRNKITAKRADGFSFPAEITLTPLKQSGQVFFVIFIRDITAQQHAETLLLEARNQAEQASQAKSRFLAMMSHEIRTPIVGVIGILDLLSDDHFLSQNQLQLIHQAQESSENLLGILNDILDWSRVEQGRLELNIENFSIEHVLLSINQLVSPLASAKNLNLSIIKDDNVPNFLAGDPSRLRQVLLNLLSNAIKFTEKGNIALEVSTETPNAPIGHICHLTFVVKDEGIGISKADQKLLFKEFSQLDPASRNRTGGTGLGLAISLRLTHLMEGHITVESEVKKGTTFSVHLPFKVVEKYEQPKQSDKQKLKPTHAYRILLVEDVKTNHFVIRKQLEEAGYDVSSAWDGLEAVNICDQQKFDIILIDMAMPNMDGLQATKQLRKNNINASIIGLSAHAFKEDKEAAFEAGMNAFLTKPVRKTQLLKKLSSFWPQHPVEAPAKEKSNETGKPKSLKKKQEKDAKAPKSGHTRNLAENNSKSTPNTSQEPIVDAATLQQLKEEIGEESFAFILSHFSEDNVAFIENLKNFQNGEEDDKEKVVRSAHSLKGSSSSLGFAALSSLAATIELSLREDKQDIFEQHIESLFKIWQKTTAFIDSQTK